jgi:cytochrome c oxidase assembly factor CtaG/cytochrome c2
MRIRFAGVVSLCAVTFGAAPLAAHEGEPLAPHDLWGAWTFDAGTTIPLVLAAVLYAIGMRKLTRDAAAHGQATRRWRAAGFTVGWLTLAIALLSPVHAAAEALFSVHMVQHEMLIVVAAPLLVLSRPLVPILWALPAPWRRRLGRTLQKRPVRRAWAVLSSMPVAWALHAVAIWIWHLPVLYDRTLTSSIAHAAQHASFLATALLFWWSIARGRAARTAGVLALFTTAVHTGALGALIALSPTPWYPRYGETSGAWGLTALEDQQLAGLIMWMPATIAYVAGALWLAAGWLREPRARTAIARASLGSAALLIPLLGGCRQKSAQVEGSMVGGDATRGQLAMRAYGCTACHAVPRMLGDNPSVGPALEGFGGRAYIAGVLPNTPENLLRWILDPPSVDSLTAMPNVGVTPHDAVDIAEYLYTLR